MSIVFIVFCIAWCCQLILVFIDCMFLFFFFKQKTAYEMRISDRSSDVCSSDLSILVGSSHIQSIQLHKALSHESDGGGGMLVECLRSACEGNEIGRASCRERVCQYV